MAPKLSVVVIGGGASGVAVAQTLDKKLNVATHSLTLVTGRDYYLHLPATLRMLVNPEADLENNAALPYDNLFGTGNGVGRLSKIIYAKVDHVEEKSGGAGGLVHLSNGEKINWDVLVIASGSVWKGPLNVPSTRKDLLLWTKTWQEKFSKARKVVLVGGGAVGLELAGELRDFQPKASVTLVQAADKALNATYHDKLRNQVTAQLEARGVNVILGDSIESLDPESLEGTVTLGSRTVTTRNGVTIEADLVIPTFGPRGVHTDFLTTGSSPTIAASVLENTHLDVKPTLQLKSNPRVFACGDVIEWPEQHMLTKTGPHADVVIPNVISVLNGLQRGAKDLGTVRGLKNYGGFMEMIIVTNGQTRGSMYMKAFGRPMVMGNGAASMMKSKSLFLPMAKKAVNYKSK
jgi:NADH dehydrogenase FAD-containing subunit